MKDKIKECFTLLSNAIQAGKIYAEDHPVYRDFVAKLFAHLQVILGQKRDVILGVVDGELAWEDEIFFELSRKPGSLAGFLVGRRIEQIAFRQGLTFDELSRFVAFLSRMRKPGPEAEPQEVAIDGVENIRIGRLRAAAESAAGPTEEPPPGILVQFRESLESATRSLTNVLQEEEVDALDLRFSLFNVMENFAGRHQELLNLISVKEKDVLTYVHLLNVSLLSMVFAARLNYGRDDIMDIGAAALFHDIGKLAVESEILQKKGKLDDREIDRMRDHPVLGARLLLGYREAIGPLAVIVAFEHHLREDLTGYPQVRFPRKPHVASQIVSLCDVYDALALRRAYKEDLPPDKIHAAMTAERGKAFDAGLLDRFFEIMGVWPVGTLVLLNDYKVAVVRAAEEKDIFRPRIEVIAPEEYREVIALTDRPELSIVEALHPQTRGRPYVHLLKD
jgi:HD-GYP domain-containing protein (c-di-GMP phosphodiesterase class II)